MVASIDLKNKNLTLISIPRDTKVEIEGQIPQKINHAYWFGKSKLTMETINKNFGLDIKNYALIDYKGLIKVINKIGGVEVELSSAEINYINTYMGYIAKITGEKEVKVTAKPGVVKLNGLQAVVHAGNRKVDNDFKRTERQRDILFKIIEKVNTLGEIDKLDVLRYFLNCIETNIEQNKIEALFVKNMFAAIDLKESIYTTQIPSKELKSGKDGSSKIYTGEVTYHFIPDIELAKKQFRQYIYERTQFKK